MPDTPQRFTIGTLAKESGVHVETIRFYQLKGLLVPPPKPYGGIRRYHEADAARLRFIKAAQGIGFNLDEIAELLRLDDGTHCREAATLAAQRLADVRARLKQLRRMEKALSQLVTACQATRGRVSCPLIEALQTGAAAG